jgi:GxxExxY protein
MEIYKHSDLTHKIIGCAMQVHSFFGNAFPEVIYQRALAVEFAKAGLNFQREIEVSIFYKDYKEPVGKRKVDFLVEGLVLVELKAMSELADSHLNQILNYLKAYQIEIGLLINFGEKSLNFKRLILSEKYKSSQIKSE